MTSLPSKRTTGLPLSTLGTSVGWAAAPATSLLFLSKAAVEAEIPQQLGLTKQIAVVQGCRTVGKANLIHNDVTPTIEVDPETYEVRADGELLTCEPATVLPMAQRYFLF